MAKEDEHGSKQIKGTAYRGQGVGGTQNENKFL
jgi:hypothetical protein